MQGQYSAVYFRHQQLPRCGRNEKHAEAMSAELDLQQDKTAYIFLMFPIK